MVRDTLDEQLEYREDTVTYNGRNDFLRYIFEQSKCGYSLHYATAATLMLRYFGVPARYVEGYYLPGDEAADYASGENIILSEAHAHAWTEYYLDGVGWIRRLEGEESDLARKAYNRRFPVARMLSAPVWEIRLDEIKFTDNTLGFGKKMIWLRDSGTEQA